MEDLNKRIAYLEKDIEDLEKEVMLNSRWCIILQWLLTI